jgi:hypothetical protein
MAAPALDTATVPAATGRSRTTTAALLIVGGLLMAVGGQMHPRGSGDTVDEHLLAMFDSSMWVGAHTVSLVGALVSVLAFVAAWRAEVFGPGVQRVLPLVIVGWAFGVIELVPHLLAAGDASALAHHQATPVLDLHVGLQTVAGPAVGLTGALLAVAVARAAGTWPARVLAAVAVLGGVVFAAAGPLVVLTGDPWVTILFPFQAGLAIWLVGTGVRLLRR